MYLRSVTMSLVQDSSWTDIRCPFEKRRDATAVFWDNVVYILGGSQLFPIKRMDCYNVLKDSWYSKLGPPTPRDSLAACAAQGKIYTSGGSEVGKDRVFAASTECEMQSADEMLIVFLLERMTTESI